MGGTRRAPLLLCPRVLWRPFCHFTDKGGNRLDRRVSFPDVLLLIKKRAPSPLPKMADVSAEEKVSLRVGNRTPLSAGGPPAEARGLTRFWMPAARRPSASHGHSHGASLSWRSLSWSLAAWLALRPPPGHPSAPISGSALLPLPGWHPEHGEGVAGTHLGPRARSAGSCSGSSWRSGGPSTPAPRCKTPPLERGCHTNFTTFPRLSWGQSFLLMLRNAREGVHP